MRTAIRTTVRASDAESAELFRDRVVAVAEALPGSIVVSVGETAADFSVRHEVRARAECVRAADGDDRGHDLVLSTTDEALGGTEVVARVAEVWRAVPFSATERDAVLASVPVLRSAAEARPGVLSGVAAVVTGHFLTDLVALVDALVTCGVDPTDVLVLQKDYEYDLRHRVRADLLRTGVTVAPASDCAVAVAEHTERVRRLGRRVVGLDDGGYLVSALRELPGSVVESWAGIAEQTMSGIYRLTDGEVPVPVFPVAQSSAKRQVESYWIAEKVVSRIVDLTPELKLEGAAALVVGFGAVGEEIAEALRRRRMRVAVHDADVLALLRAHELGLDTDRDLVALVDRHAPVVVVGTTGRPSIGAEALAALRRDAVLASASSRDVEIDLAALAEVAVAVDASVPGRTVHRLSSGVRATVLGDGRPVNFWRTDGLRNELSDLVYAAMLVGAVELAEGRSGSRVTADRADEVIAASSILEHYYDLYGPRVPERVAS